LELFDSARKAGLHSYGEWEREILGHAALLHDIGAFLSYGNHHTHSYYLINNADLLGFHKAELTMMALVALFHRRGLPSAEQPEYAALDRDDRNRVKFLSLILRLVESLDRSHQNVVQHATIQVTGDAQLELWGLKSRERAVRKTLGRHLVITVDERPAVPAGTALSEGRDKLGERPAELRSVDPVP
jgi:exopolyphosphatase/guanosine-5'-triphosphate,3'-diphosphate pyrophosphatase